MAVELKKGKVTYGRSYDHYAYWRYDKDGRNGVIIHVIKGMPLSIEFNYYCPGNTYLDEDAVLITREEFTLMMNKMKQKIRNFKS